MRQSHVLPPQIGLPSSGLTTPWSMHNCVRWRVIDVLDPCLDWVSVGLQAITGLHMYLPPHFIEADAGAVAALVAEFPLATLVATGPGGLLANHIPMLLAPDDRLIGHVAAANEIHRVIGEDAAVLAVFSGEDGYVTPNWYPRQGGTPPCRADMELPCRSCSWPHQLHSRPKRKRAIVGEVTARFEREMNGGCRRGNGRRAGWFHGRPAGVDCRV